MENMIPLNSTSNSCYTYYITGHRKDTQLPVSGAHFAGASASYTGKASLPPQHAHPALHAHPGQKLLYDPTLPSSKKAGGRCL